MSEKSHTMRVICGDCGSRWPDVVVEGCIFCGSKKVAPYWICPGCWGISMRGGAWACWCRKCVDKYDEERRASTEGRLFDEMLRSHGRRGRNSREPHWGAEEEARAAAFTG